MSGESPRWLEELSRELGLEDTPPPVDEPETEISLAEAVKRVQFTPQGWARVAEVILRADETIAPALFGRVLSASDDDMFMFTAMIALPYNLTKTLGYDEKRCAQLITFVAASYAIAVVKGYELGKADADDEAG